MKHTWRWLVAGLVLFALAGAVQARTAPLVVPQPVAVPAGLSDEQVVKDIKRALASRGWEVTGEQPGRIDATLHLREHVATIGSTMTRRRSVSPTSTAPTSTTRTSAASG